MIPHVLHIKNFLSYGPETQIIDFRPYSLISLSGKNGHGKSALLDAITWAIWGQARKSSGQSKPDAGLMHLGQKHMMVILEFEVNGNIYRARREYLHTQSKPFATLDFGIQNEDGKIIPLTDKTIKDTQEKIERTIGITYDSFANSTFLRQGQSNEFSKKSPKERKEILAQILQLQRFETQKKIAMAHARKLGQQHQAKMHIQERIMHELTDLATVNDQFLQLQEQLQILQGQLATVHNLIEANKQNEQALTAQQNQWQFLQKQELELQEKLDTLQGEIQKKQFELAAPKVTVSKQDLQVLEQKANAKLQEIQNAQHEKNQLKELYLSTKEELNKLTQKAQQEFELCSQTISTKQIKQEETLKYLLQQKNKEHETALELTQQIEASSLQISKFAQTIEAADANKKDYDQRKAHHEKMRQSYEQICAEGTYVKQYLQKIEHDKNALKSQNHKACLLCTQPISKQQQVEIQEKLELQRAELELQLSGLKTTATELKSSMAQDVATMAICEKLQQESMQTRAQLEQHQLLCKRLELQLLSAQQNLTKIEVEEKKLRSELASTAAQIQDLQKSYTQQLQQGEIQEQAARLKEIETKGRALPQSSAEIYQAAQRDLDQARVALANFKELPSQLQDQAELSQMKLHETQLQEQLEKLKLNLKDFDSVPEKLGILKQKELEVELNKKRLDLELQHALVLQGTLQHKQKKQIELEREMAKVSKEVKSLHGEMSDYQEIAKALGKDGIQALLIEQAIPEIEHETNLILARLTSNQTQIFIESLRDLKKGGSKETLDIKIADPFGLRDYEMFSGGEAFRIDFALRIGISKLLARRAGTTLQTIFIDEGFGSQDDEGLSLIMDNIYKIQEEFAKIIVVSHLQEMKEQFPVQFIVEKKRSGSSVSIVHQG